MIPEIENVEDLSDEEADDNAEGLQQLMKLYKNNSLKIKKPREFSPMKGMNKDSEKSSKRKRDHSKTNTSASKKEASSLRKSKDDLSSAENQTEISKSKK